MRSPLRVYNEWFEAWYDRTHPAPPAPSFDPADYAEVAARTGVDAELLASRAEVANLPTGRAAGDTLPGRVGRGYRHWRYKR
jgi:hypothetical protein